MKKAAVLLQNQLDTKCLQHAERRYGVGGGGMLPLCLLSLGQWGREPTRT